MVPSLARHSPSLPPGAYVGQQAQVPGDEGTRVGRWAQGVLGSRVGEPLNQRKIGSSSMLMPEWGFEGCIGVGWMRGEQSPHQRNRHLERCGDKGVGRLGRNVMPNTQEKEHEETRASEASAGARGRNRSPGSAS